VMSEFLNHFIHTLLSMQEDARSIFLVHYSSSASILYAR